jgi:hypothetical protein
VSSLFVKYFNQCVPDNSSVVPTNRVRLGLLVNTHAFIKAAGASAAAANVDGRQPKAACSTVVGSSSTV